MSYAQNGLIEAGDYNGLVGSSPSSTANQLNTVYSVGSGAWGYGQTAVSQVSQTGLVSATQWSTAINALNACYKHQTGAATAIDTTKITAGNVVAYLSAFSSGMTTIYTNALTATTTGSTITGAQFTGSEVVANQQSAAGASFIRTATFTSVDAARYFFNNGGKLNFVVVSVTPNDGTLRSLDMQTVAATNLGGLTSFAANTNGGRTGTGGTQTTNTTNVGYYGLTTSNVVIQKITSLTSGYTSDYAQISVKTDGAAGSNNANGSTLTFNLDIYSAARPTLPAPPPAAPGGTAPTTNIVTNDSINVTVVTRMDVVYPETATSGFSNVWGAVSIT